ncbi:nucleoside-triphosphatase [Planosporangium mesophilum]|uniref:nucleoside-triphosphatase n=1 Tax=Planosporangium mesophilum TaxID=689768 RepID=UPI00143B9DD6|nr:hypothetical protein [Planosporangium mesophilum]
MSRLAVPPRLLLTGPPGVGKSTTIGRLVQLLQEHRLPVGGFVTGREPGARPVGSGGRTLPDDHAPA